MFVHQQQLRFLRSALFVVSVAGCSYPGAKVAAVKDPFLTPAAKVAPAAAKPLAVPLPLPPLPVVPASVPPADDSTPTVSLTSYGDNGSTPQAEVLVTPPEAPLAPQTSVDNEHVSEVESPGGQTPPPGGVYPIDLANALALGGADNLQVRLARTRLFQAQARHFEAKTLWLPSIRFGVGYNKHDGRIQATEGNILEVNRNSLFYGGGLGLGAAPLAAGAAGPPRLFVNLSLADAYFKPLATCQEVAAHGAAERVATNDSLAQIAQGYHTLIAAYGRRANANSARELTENMVGLVEDFEREGFSSQTEVHRARTALGRWQGDVADAQRLVVVRSAELARVLRLPAQVQLAPVEDAVMPVDFVDTAMGVDAMIAMAMGSRPELSQHAAQREAACFRVQEEKWRPWIPNVQVGASGGNFGGGPSSDYLNAASRSDVDLLAVWEWKNLGLGNVALQRQRRGQLHERVLDLEAVRDRVAAEVVAAAADVASYRQQMEIAEVSIAAAGESYQLNQQRIRASEGLPIELLQSIAALTDARNTYTEAVANYNRAQYRLLRALGNPAG